MLDGMDLEMDPLEELLASLRQGIQVAADAPERDDFTLYYEKLLGWKFPSHFRKHIDRIVDPKVPFLLILVPPGHGKTTLLSTMAAWMLGNDPNIRIIIATHTTGYSEQIVGNITNLLTHPVSARAFGDLIPSKELGLQWRQGARTVKRTDYRIKDPSLLALGVGSSTIGYRCDVILADDLVAETNSMTDVMRSHVSRWYWNSLEKRLDPGGIIRIFGSRFYTYDLYGELIAKGLPYIALETTPENPLWPSMYPKERIEEFMERDYFSYMAQCRQDPQDLGGAFLKESWLHYYLEAPENLRIYQGIDPCVTDSSHSDYLAIVTVGVDINENVYILDIYRSQADLEGQCEAIIAQYEKWDPIMVGIEVNASQSMLMQYILQSRALRLFPVQNQMSKSLRFASMASLFRSKKVLLPAYTYTGGFVKPHPYKAEPLVNEWRAFPSSTHDDVLDATEIALSVALRIKVGAATSNVDAAMKATGESAKRRRVYVPSRFVTSPIFH